jgi:hypothetical protein
MAADSALGHLQSSKYEEETVSQETGVHSGEQEKEGEEGVWY